MQSDGLQAPRNFRVGRRHANGDILVSAIDIFWTVWAVAFLARERFPERGPFRAWGGNHEIRVEAPKCFKNRFTAMLIILHEFTPRSRIRHAIDMECFAPLSRCLRLRQYWAHDFLI